MAVDLPEIPTEIGTEWQNPQTGIVYEWNGKRWVAKPGETNLEDVAYLSASQTFTGSNVFENKTYLRSDDDSHRLYMKDKDGVTNLTVFPTGNITSKGSIQFTPQKSSTFAERYGSKIRVDTPVGWKSSDGDFGFYVDISRANTQYNRFVVGGRGAREKAFEVYDDGVGRMRVYGKGSFDGNCDVGGALTVDGHCDFKGDVIFEDDVVFNKQVTVEDAQVNGTLTVEDAQVNGTLTVDGSTDFKSDVTFEDVQVNNSLTVDGFANFKGSATFNEVVTFIKKITTQDIKVTGILDVSTASHTTKAALPKSYFTPVLKEFNGAFRSIYINHETNGTSDPPIAIKAGTSSSSLIELRNNSGSARFGINVHNSYMYGGTSSSPWIPSSNHHFAVKKYVDDQVSAVDNRITDSSGPTGMWFKYGGDTGSLSQGQFILYNNRLVFDTYNDDSLLWMGGLTSETSEVGIWSHCSIYRQSGNLYILEYMYQLEKMRVGTSISGRRSLNFTKIYRKFGSGLPTINSRYLISCGGFF